MAIDLPFTIGKVDYGEYTDLSGRENFDFSPDNKSTNCERVLRCAWSDRYNLMNAILASPNHPSVGYAQACTFAFEGLGVGTDENTWTQAKVTVGYKNILAKEVSVRTYAENVSLDKEGFEFSSGSGPEQKALTTDPRAYVTFSEVCVTLSSVFLLEEDVWAGMVNLVNNATINFIGAGGKTWSAGQALYTGYDLTQRLSTGGANVYQVAHKFLCAEVDHRKKYNPFIGDFDLVKNKVTGDDLYDEGNFAVLGI